MKMIRNHDHNFLKLLIFKQILFSPQVKRSVIISNKRVIYEFLNDLRLGSWEIRKFQENLKTS